MKNCRRLVLLCQLCWLAGTVLTQLAAFTDEVAAQVQLTDVTEQSGITFRHTDGSSGNRYIVETVTAGVALLDYDGDGDLDIYLLNGSPLQGTRSDTTPTNELYRNDGDWRFTNVTESAGVGQAGYALGVAAADYDNDGATDIYVSNFGPNVLFHNNGDGTFSEVASVARVGNGDKVGAGVSFVDVDADGHLDLYVANYVRFSFDLHKPHVHKGFPAYISPMVYDAQADALYRNLGDGSFEDISERSGITEVLGLGMGIISADYDDDGDTDIFVCNDVNSNFLWQNDGHGNFKDAALIAGTALDLHGTAQGSMGVDAADFDNDGRIDFHATSYAQEWATLYHNLGDGLFEDNTGVSSAGAGTFPHVTWGNGFADFDNDGYQDLLIACGHLDDNVHLRDRTTAFALPNIFLHNQGNGSFRNITEQAGSGMKAVHSSRGLAVADLDSDGDVDAVFLNSRRPPTLLRNDTENTASCLAIQLHGVEANRQGIGARVRVTAGDLVQTMQVHSGRGYQSDSAKRLHFGLGNRREVEKIEVRWPGGETERYAPPSDAGIYHVFEGTTD